MIMVDCMYHAFAVEVRRTEENIHRFFPCGLFPMLAYVVVNVVASACPCEGVTCSVPPLGAVFTVSTI
jgi:hypothetical protein